MKIFASFTTAPMFLTDLRYQLPHFEHRSALNASLDWGLVLDVGPGEFPPIVECCEYPDLLWVLPREGF